MMSNTTTPPEKGTSHEDAAVDSGKAIPDPSDTKHPAGEDQAAENADTESAG